MSTSFNRVTWPRVGLGGLKHTQIGCTLLIESKDHILIEQSPVF